MRRIDRAFRKLELLSSAREVFARKGFAATRIEEIAQQVGVSKATVYIYFPSKDALLKAVIQETFRPNIAQIVRLSLKKSLPVALRMRRIMPLLWSLMTATPFASVLKLVISESQNFPDISRLYYCEVLDKIISTMSTLIAQGIENGEFRGGDPITLTNILLSPLLLHMISPRLATSPNNVTHFKEPDIVAITDFLLKGLQQQ